MTPEEVFQAIKYKITVDGYGVRKYYNHANQLHRDEGAAVEYPDGTKHWYQNGVLHRVNGPAIDYGSEGGLWFIHGRRCSKKEYGVWASKGAV